MAGPLTPQQPPIHVDVVVATTATSTATTSTSCFSTTASSTTRTTRTMVTARDSDGEDAAQIRKENEMIHRKTRRRRQRTYPITNPQQLQLQPQPRRRDFRRRCSGSLGFVAAVLLHVLLLIVAVMALSSSVAALEILLPSTTSSSSTTTSSSTSTTTEKSNNTTNAANSNSTTTAPASTSTSTNSTSSPADTTTTTSWSNAESHLTFLGTTTTKSGYDTELGSDSICWKSQSGILTLATNDTNNTNDNSSSTHNHHETASSGQQQPTNKLPNPLVRNFYIQGYVERLFDCPPNNSLTAWAPKDREPALPFGGAGGGGGGVGTPNHSVEGIRLRTNRFYNYSVQFSIDLSSLYGVALVSDINSTAAATTNVRHSFVAVQIVNCVLGLVGLCTPFIHEEANARLTANNQSLFVARGDDHGGTHVHSGHVYVPLDPEQGPYYTNVNVQIPMIVHEPGYYYSIASLELYVLQQDTEDSAVVAEMMAAAQNLTASALLEAGYTILRYDMANALTDGQRLVTYQLPIHILPMSEAVRIFSLISIGMAVSVLLFLLVQTIRHQHHQVLMLSQGPFLIVFLVAALVSNISTYFLQPVSVTYCRLGPPLLLISLQLFEAVQVGRLWRIHAVISPLLHKRVVAWGSRSSRNMNTNNSLEKTQWWWWWWCGCNKNNNNNDDRRNIANRSVIDSLRHRITLSLSATSSKSGAPASGRSGAPARAGFRRQVTQKQLALVIAICTLPQVLIQILVLALQPAQLTLELNPDESIGRYMCHFPEGVTNGTSIANYGYLCFFLLLLIKNIAAYWTRHLPSLFNESAVIFQVAVINFLLVLFGGAGVAMTNQPTTNPAIKYLTYLLVTLITTHVSATRIVLPKLKMVWDNETIVVSKLVYDHAQAARHKEALERARRQAARQTNNNSHTSAVTASGRSRKQAHITGLQPESATSHGYSGYHHYHHGGHGGGSTTSAVDDLADIARATTTSRPSVISSGDASDISNYFAETTTIQNHNVTATVESQDKDNNNNRRNNNKLETNRPWCSSSISSSGDNPYSTTIAEDTSDCPPPPPQEYRDELADSAEGPQGNEEVHPSIKDKSDDEEDSDDDDDDDDIVENDDFIDDMDPKLRGPESRSKLERNELDLEAAQAPLPVPGRLLASSSLSSFGRYNYHDDMSSLNLAGFPPYEENETTVQDGSEVDDLGKRKTGPLKFSLFSADDPSRRKSISVRQISQAASKNGSVRRSVRFRRMQSERPRLSTVTPPMPPHPSSAPLGQKAQEQHDQQQHGAVVPQHPDGTQSRSGGRKILIRECETPARRVVLKMMDLQSHLAHINQRVMTGLAVSQDDWLLARHLTERLQVTLSHDVQFEWEPTTTTTTTATSTTPVHHAEERLSPVMDHSQSSHHRDDPHHSLVVPPSPRHSSRKNSNNNNKHHGSGTTNTMAVDEEGEDEEHD